MLHSFPILQIGFTVLWSLLIVYLHAFFDFNQEKKGNVTNHVLETIVEAIIFLSGESINFIHHQAFALYLSGTIFFFWSFKFLFFPELLNELRDLPFGYVGTTSGKFKASWLDTLTAHWSVITLLIFKLAALSIAIVLNLYIIPLILK